jgi:hypothetical protein
MTSWRRPAQPLVTVLLTIAIVVSAGYAFAQFRNRGFGVLGVGSGLAPKQFPDRDFAICRLVYTESQQPFAGGWRTDYPLGDRNLSIRFSELTKTRVSRASDGSRNHYLVRATDDQLFQCPFLIGGDVGSADFTPVEADRLRQYFLKGGFLYTDDMWGDDEWEAWQVQIAKVLPPDKYPIEEVPVSDPIFSSQFVVDHMPQIPNYPYWQRSGGDTSERQEYSRVPHFHAIRDEHGRVMVAMTRNTDIADSWEREAENPTYFYRFSPTGYALGSNILLHALTH